MKAPNPPPPTQQPPPPTNQQQNPNNPPRGIGAGARGRQDGDVGSWPGKKPKKSKTLMVRNAKQRVLASRRCKRGDFQKAERKSPAGRVGPSKGEKRGGWQEVSWGLEEGGR